MPNVRRARRFLISITSLALLMVFSAQLVAAEPIDPPASLTPPIPPGITNLRCVETGAGITCTFDVDSPAEPAPHVMVQCDDGVVLEQGTGTQRAITRHYDRSGTLVDEVRHVAYDGIIYNGADPDRAGTRDGRFKVVLDFEGGALLALTYTGLTSQVSVAGQGVVALDAGRVVIDLNTSTVLSSNGRHDYIFPGLLGPGFGLNVTPNTQPICAALT
jgi:hypothetical protein